LKESLVVGTGVCDEERLVVLGGSIPELGTLALDVAVHHGQDGVSPHAIGFYMSLLVLMSAFLLVSILASSRG